MHPALPLAPAGTKVFVSSIAASGSQVFVVGSTQRGRNGSSQLAFGASAATGTRTAFHPIIRKGIATGVAASGSVVYLAGGFKTVGGARRCGLASVTAATGALRRWTSETCLTESPLAMTATASSLFVGRLHGFLAVRADTGKRLTWSRRISLAFHSAGVASLARLRAHASTSGPRGCGSGDRLRTGARGLPRAEHDERRAPALAGAGRASPERARARGLRRAGARVRFVHDLIGEGGIAARERVPALL